MALISSTTIITSVSLFHLTIAFFFLSNPRAVNDQVLVYVLGESMRMPPVADFDAQSPALAFLAAVLAGVGLSDLVALSMPEDLGALYYWGTQAPLRSLVAMLFVFYSYFLGPSSPLYAPRRARSADAAYRPAGWGGDGLKNRLFFTFMFIEMVAWFWIWITLREERHAVVERLRRRQRSKHANE